MMRKPLPLELIDSLLAPEPTEAELAKEDAEISPAMWLVAGYLGKDLSPSERAHFERRLETDEDFRDEVEPVLLAWKHAPNEEHPEYAEMRRGWLRFRRQMGLPPLTDEDRRDEQEWGRHGGPPGHSRTRRVLQLTGVFVGIIVVLIAAYVDFTGVPEWALPGNLHTAVAPTDTLGRGLPPGTVAEISSTKVPMRGGGDVTLYHGARVTWHDRAAANGVREIRIEDGDANFVLNPFRKGEKYLVVTPAAVVQVTSVAVFTVDAHIPSVTTVQVIMGEVTLSSRGGLELFTKRLLPGLNGRAEFGFPAEVVK